MKKNWMRRSVAALLLAAVLITTGGARALQTTTGRHWDTAGEQVEVARTFGGARTLGRYLN
jgi:hypothetical protein